VLEPPLDVADELDEVPLEALEALALALAVVFVWVAASVPNATKAPSETPSASFFSARAFASACALGMRAGAGRIVAVRGGRVWPALGAG
jgi:hypothetical protein